MRTFSAVELQFMWPASCVSRRESYVRLWRKRRIAGRIWKCRYGSDFGPLERPLLAHSSHPPHDHERQESPLLGHSLLLNLRRVTPLSFAGFQIEFMNASASVTREYGGKPATDVTGLRLVPLFPLLLAA